MRRSNAVIARKEREKAKEETNSVTVMKERINKLGFISSVEFMLHSKNEAILTC